MRGLDQYLVQKGKTSMNAHGVALVDAGGCDKIYKRANAIRALKYRAASFRDDDKKPDGQAELAFTSSGGTVMKWRDNYALEDELFECLPIPAVRAMIDRAVEIHGQELIEAHIDSYSSGLHTLTECRNELTPERRKILGNAACNKSNPWFKSVTWMEGVTKDIIGPHIKSAEAPLLNVVKQNTRVD